MIKNSELNRALDFLLNVFISELPDKPPSEQAQDHQIETDNVHLINKFLYSLFKKQLNEQVH